MTGSASVKGGILDANGIIGLAKSGSFSLLPHVFAVKPYLDKMRQLGFGIPQGLYEEILRALGE